ncbi:hypothetical protein HEP87_58760 [Streptomyces sp. S1D4-11]
MRFAPTDEQVELGRTAERLLADAAAGNPVPPAWEAVPQLLDAADAATADTLQAHGGIGFTWEYPSHVLLRRARARRALLGALTRRLDVLADLILSPQGR